MLLLFSHARTCFNIRNTYQSLPIEGFWQFLLRLVECERQYAFNNIVDTKQRVMGLLLDGTGADEDNTKFLLVTKVHNAALRGLKLTRQEECDARRYFPSAL